MWQIYTIRSCRPKRILLFSISACSLPSIYIPLFSVFNINYYLGNWIYLTHRQTIQHIMRYTVRLHRTRTERHISRFVVERPPPATGSLTASLLIHVQMQVHVARHTFHPYINKSLASNTHCVPIEAVCIYIMCTILP